MIDLFPLFPSQRCRSLFAGLCIVLSLVSIYTELHAQIISGKRMKPNIIIFLTDDLGYGDLASYGNAEVKTPNLDKFAREGVLMTDMHSAATVCSPSRASLLTGRNPYRSGFYSIAGFYGTTLSRDEITLPQLLKEIGYQTSFFGKWHLSKLESSKEVSVNEMGFDYSFATSVNSFNTGPRNPDKFLRNGVAVGPVEGWYVDIIATEAQEWIENAWDRRSPFFMIVSTNEPHTPLDPPKSLAQLYDDIDSLKIMRMDRFGGVKRPQRDLSRFFKEYYGTVSQIDETFGSFMSYLDRKGLRDSTLVIFTSDNGPEYPVTSEESNDAWEDPLRDKCFGSPGSLRGMKRYPHEGGHRVPGLVRWPGVIPQGTVSDKLFNGTDLLPTICKLVGARIPNDRRIDGTDAFNAFLNRDYEREIPPIWFFPAGYSHLPGMMHMAMRQGEFVLVARLADDKDLLDGKKSFGKYPVVDWVKTAVPDTYELYNLKKDVEQKNNLSEREPEVLAALVSKIKALWKEIRDEGPWWGNQLDSEN